jgi:hypothetical protein
MGETIQKPQFANCLFDKSFLRKEQAQAFALCLSEA